MSTALKVTSALAAASGVAVIVVGSWMSSMDVVVPKTLEERLASDGLRFLSFNKLSGHDDQSSDYSSWYNMLQSSNLDASFKFAQWDESKVTQEWAKINVMKEKCSSVLKVLDSDPTFGKNMEDARKFCVSKA